VKLIKYPLACIAACLPLASGYSTPASATTTGPTAATVTGVAEGRSYTVGVVPSWSSPSGQQTAGYMDGHPFEKGTALKSAGSHTLAVVTRRGDQEAATTSHFTIVRPELLGGYARSGWSWSESAPIAAGKLNHIFYAFANISGTNIVSAPGSNDASNMAYLNRLKAANPGLRVLLSINGNGFSDAALTTESRAAFAQSAVGWIDTYHLDGIDIDWEYPTHTPDARPEDKHNFTLLLQAVRSALDAAGARDGHYYELTIATGTDQTYLDAVEIDKIAPYVDDMNLMTYDFAGGWSDHTAHFTNLRDAPYGTVDSVGSAVSVFRKAGVPANKLVVGAAFYGAAWFNVRSTAHNGLGQAADLGGPLVARSDIMNYLLRTDPAGHFTFQKYWDSVANAPYLFDGHTWVSYDDPRSVFDKAAFARDRGLGGAMFWEYALDQTGILVDALHSGMMSGHGYPDTTVPQPHVDGIADGAAAPGPVSATWSSEPDTWYAATLNGKPYSAGTPVTTPGDYSLVLAALNVRSELRTSTVVHFSIG
jgi:GH18 family chitinase